jgi:acyl-CoA synthetase (AMP-forming)/AMP-acid ligase II
VEALFATFKASLVPVNTNYRYTDAELAYLWRNADAEAVVFHGRFADRCAALRPDLPEVRAWIWVDDGSGPCPEWAWPYEEVASGDPGRGLRPWTRTGDDLFLLYTGGTTGSPKGVMWPQHSLFRSIERGHGTPLEPADAQVHADRLRLPGQRVVAAAPLMHGTACFFAMSRLTHGGCIVTLPGSTFDPVALLDTLEAEQAKGVCIVGDAFGRPIAAALAAEPGRWDLSALRVIFSSGVMFSPECKAALLVHAPRAVVADSLGSSESGGLAVETTAAGERSRSGGFRIGPTTRVVDDDGRDVVPGSGQAGRMAISGDIPIGYYGDPEKTAATFLDLDGVVHVVAGDYAEVEVDGTIRLLGRGSVCINTGGEKVFPEEVEEAVKRTAGVRDAVVVGLPDDRFGEVVTAVVEPEPGATVDRAAIDARVRADLAGYKAPRHLVVVPTIGRAPNGKADYRRLRREAAAAVGVPLR